MRKLMFAVLLTVTAMIFASNTKVVVFGIINNYAQEYTNETIQNVTFKAWLERIPTEVIEPADSLTQCGVLMFPDSDNPLRGVCQVDLQHFSSWDTGDMLKVLIKDYNVGKSYYYEALAEYTIDDTSSEWVYIGFEDYLGYGGEPLMVALPTAYETKTFVYPCITTEGTDFNFVGLPVETGWTKASDFDPAGINIETVTRWEASLQKFQTGVYSPVFGWCKDIPVQAGQSYALNVKSDFDFTVIGDSVEVVYDLITTAGTDLNQIVLPITKSNLTTSAMLGNDIGTDNCNTIAKWDVISQSMVVSTYSPIIQWVNSFSITTGQPLFINMKTNYTWPVGKGNSAEGDFVNNEDSKGTVAGARIVFVHITEQSGRELTEEEMRLIKFEATIDGRQEILTENSYDCGFMTIGGLSVLYVNIGNFPTAWTPGEEVTITTTNFVPMEGFQFQFLLDDLGETIYKGFDPILQGTGFPQIVDISAVIPLQGVAVSVREESGNIVLEWGWAGEDITGYNIYESDDPYGTFEYVTTVQGIDWATPASEAKKFFIVRTSDAKNSIPPKTVNVKEKN